MAPWGLIFLLLPEAVPGLAAENMCPCLEEILEIFTTPSLSLSHSKGTKREAILQEGQLEHMAEVQPPPG